MNGTGADGEKMRIAPRRTPPPAVTLSKHAATIAAVRMAGNFALDIPCTAKPF